MYTHLTQKAINQLNEVKKQWEIKNHLELTELNEKSKYINLTILDKIEIPE